MPTPISGAGYYTYTQQSSNKFWECLMTGDGLYQIRWGRIGTKGQFQHGVSRYTAAERVEEKLRKGYKLTDSRHKTVMDVERTALQAGIASVVAAADPLPAARPRPRL